MLCLIGLAAIYSVDFSRGAADFLFAKKQLVALSIGLVLLLALASSNYKFLESYLQPIYWLGVALLLAVLFFGKTVRGTTGWFSFGSFNFQPVELAKFTVILALAKYFERSVPRRFSWKSIWQSLLLAAIPAGLVFAQPDFGGALLILAIWAILLLIFGVRKTHLAILVGGALLSFVVAWFFVLAPYQRERFLIFINPASDPQGAGYNVRQSIIAIGAGREFGRGLGFGSQSQLKFLPESQTDFVFAVIAEELGFAVTFFVIGMFGFLLFRFLRIALKARRRDDFSAFLALGVTALFFLEFTVNVGMNLGLMPVMGIAAPFLSYGGSSLVAHLAMVGVMLAVAERS